MTGGRRVALSTALGLILGSCGDSRPLVLIDLSPLPAQPGKLRVSLSYDGQAAKTPSPIEFDLSMHREGESATFGVRLPGQTNGDLTIGALVLDAAGCAAGLGTGAARPVAAQPQVHIRLEAPPADLPADARCNEPDKTPLIVRIAPAQAPSHGASDRIQVQGWGFIPSGGDCPLLTVDGNPATGVLCPSLNELTADLPTTRGRLGNVAVRVLNRGNMRAGTRRDLFRYYAADLALSPSAAGPLTALAMPTALTAADSNGDGRPDLMVASGSSSQVQVLQNDGTGGFPVQGRTTVDVGARPSAIGMADIDGDGRQDVIVANAGDGSVSLVRQGPLGTRFTAGPSERLFVDLEPTSLALPSVNGDASADLVVLNRVSRTLNVFVNTSGGSYPRAGRRDYSIGREATWLQAADLNGDGQVDLICNGQSGVTVLAHLGDRDFATGGSIRLDLINAVQAAVGDLDGDGSVDLVWAAPGGAVNVLRNNGSGVLTSRGSKPVATGVEISALALADFDLDGRRDVIALSSAGGKILVLRNELEAPTVTDALRLALTQPVDQQPTAMAVGDA